MGRKKHLKETLIAVAYFLTLLGLIMILNTSSASHALKLKNPYSVFLKQLVWLIVSTVIFFLIWEIDTQKLRKAIPYAVIISFVLLILLIIPGITKPVKGAKRWFFLPGGISLQPVEFIKILWVLYLADYLDRHRKELYDLKILIGPLILLVLYSALIFSQPDFGNTVLFFLIFSIVFFIGKVPVSRILLLFIFIIPFAYWAVMGTEYRRARIRAFLSPGKYEKRESYQLMRSLSAIVSGGIIGKGAGSGISKLMYLPCAHTDFIFSVICEEFGIIGAVFILFLYSFFVIISLKMAIACRDNFSKIAIGGLVSVIAIEAFANIGVSIGLLPTKGLPLPFVSYGGSNLLASFIILGLMVSIYIENGERSYL